MNKELFCTYQQALDLKQLGFDDFCFDEYIPDNPGIEKEDIGLLYSDRLDSGREHYFIPSSILIPAPLKSQAFKFFREKYGLHSVVNRYPSGAFAYVIDWFAKDKDSHEKESWGDKSYDFDIAESFCIDTLIKFAKQINEGSFKVEGHVFPEFTIANIYN